ncbi:glycosyltransferase family 2 protein [Thalassovita sp.]|uniref:glycosyltransferase family 2 protein n=1 Tax=Thalassovita sp. TaxID=1979401 RepID=UPI0029DE6010|nr:glycosyltransferase family 2 protein [Thalassovita sp.]
MTDAPVLLTVVLNWRTPDMTLRAVEHALAAMDGIAGEIVVVDNDSGDGSFDKISDHVTAQGWDRVQVVQSGHNGGFGAGNNFGIRTGLSDGRKPDYVYILNSDAFPAPDAIRLLMNALQHDPALWAAGSYIHGQDGDPHQTLFRFPSVAGEFEGAIRLGPVSRLLKRSIMPLPVPDKDVRADWMAGASVLMRRDVLDEIGLFDESFFLYFEETDLFLRAARAGYRSVYVRDSHVMHIGSVSTGMKTWDRVPGYWLDSRLRYFVKNHGPAYAFAATAVHLAGGFLYWLRRRLEGKPVNTPEHYLRSLFTHHLSSALRALTGARATRRPARTKARTTNPE